MFGFAASCGGAAVPGDPGDPTQVPLALWPSEQAALVCARIVACCDASERTKFFYMNDPQCRAMQADIRSGTNNLVAQGLVVYDGKAARRCLDEVKALPCATYFDVHSDLNALAPSCAAVGRGAGQLGAPCEGFDMFCASGHCDRITQTCTPPPVCPASCAAGEYCPEGSGECAAKQEDGAICASDVECASGVCSGTTCGPLLPNGASCQLDRYCASGACVGPDSSSLTCGPQLPDGATCQNSSACASGTCVMRASTGGQTCGPPLCDGI
jgi:hypothetical protein